MECQDARDFFDVIYHDLIFRLTIMASNKQAKRIQLQDPRYFFRQFKLKLLDIKRKIYLSMSRQSIIANFKEKFKSAREAIVNKSVLRKVALCSI